jgi:L-threonylcarbamoyladenylate synthase
VKEIYRLKTRSFTKPLAAYFSDIEMMHKYIKDFTPLLSQICEKFLPGALTIVTEKNDIIADYITSNTNTLGFRIPKYDFLLDVIDSVGVPIVGTSANISNHASAKHAKDALRIFYNQIPYVFEDDHEAHGTESTVISVVKDKVKLLREGAIPFVTILNSLSL